MSWPDIIGFTGVFILLVAYFLNLFKIIEQKSYTYLCLNILGAGIACFASVLINYLPFIILEGAWTLVSAFALVKEIKKKSHMPHSARGPKSSNGFS